LADITQFNESPFREEILFDLNATFRLGNIQKDEQVWIIRMTAVKDGRTLLKKYINDTRRQTEALIHQPTHTLVLNTFRAQKGGSFEPMKRRGFVIRALFQSILISVSTVLLPHCLIPLVQIFALQKLCFFPDDIFKKNKESRVQCEGYHQTTLISLA
jgi:hypothetical protein